MARVLWDKGSAGKPIWPIFLAHIEGLLRDSQVLVISYYATVHRWDAIFRVLAA